MKTILWGALVMLSLAACKNKTEETVVTEKPIAEQETVEVANYPKTMHSIFDAHGGVTAWQKMKSLHFEIPKESGNEIHRVALQDRRSLITTDAFSIGYDGSEVWLLQKEEKGYQGNARFYHNLMFYFYAMPFVLADDGIQYSAVASTELDGKNYEGVKIEYNDGVGDASKDEYIVYFDSETHQMTWLAYTVTYRTNEKSDNWKFIKYGKWMTNNGLLLPKSLTWYQLENGKPTTPRNTMTFENVAISEQVLEAKLFEKPEGAIIAER